MMAAAPPPDVSVGVRRMEVSTTVTFLLGDDAATPPR